jgi:hypothetical protein
MGKKPYAMKEGETPAEATTAFDEPLMMIVLLLFLQKQSLAFAVYLFGIGTLHTGPGLKKKKKTTAFDEPLRLMHDFFKILLKHLPPLIVPLGSHEGHRC